MAKDKKSIISGDSGFCANECIKKGRIWCPEPKSAWGRCYKNQNLVTVRNICSSQAPQKSMSLKLWACPHTPLNCGREETIIGNFKGTKRLIKFYSQGSTKQTKFLIDNAMCRYKVLFPAEASHDDKIHLKVTKL